MARSWRRNLYLGALIAGMLGLVAGCSTGVKPIDLTYVPSSPAQEVSGNPANLTYGVTPFIDARSQKEFVAEISWPAGKDRYKPTRPLGVIVADGVIARLKSAGLKARLLDQPWDLKADGLKPGWPDVVIGGRIDRFWATTNTGDIVHNVRTDIKLHIVVGTPHGDRILYEKSIIGTANDTRALAFSSWVKNTLQDVYSAVINEFFKNGLLLTQLESVRR